MEIILISFCGIPRIRRAMAAAGWVTGLPMPLLAATVASIPARIRLLQNSRDIISPTHCAIMNGLRSPWVGYPAKRQTREYAARMARVHSAANVEEVYEGYQMAGKAGGGADKAVGTARKPKLFLDPM